MVDAFAPPTSIGQTRMQQQQQQQNNERQSLQQQSSTSLNLFLPDVDATTTAATAASMTAFADPHTLLTTTSNLLLSTIDSDIANIPDDEFGKVFAGGGIIIFGSILSTIFVGFLVENGKGGYADLVAETYANQNLGEEEESYLNSLGLGEAEKKETEEMVRAFREKKMRKAGTWTEEDEEEKKVMLAEKDMFSDYE
eukprot:CAMPEP_0183730836 /NCGR_PEP_ID=MMETSP0737-20130205/33736_1 /TAXON_ID=385413 /ORGANISM="Thalassiosira miniscula, Strain CCMP1093" /LENGTH=196 /DNA_ID=CAMNT_0025963417 /DNA_START=135 /DNA_END=725 /DNA_ORIENTATION=+